MDSVSSGPVFMISRSDESGITDLRVGEGTSEVRDLGEMTTSQGATNKASNQRAWPTRGRAETSSARLALYIEKTAGEEEHPPPVD